MDKIDLSDFFTTKSQANDFAVRLSSVIDHMYTTNFNLEKTLTTQFGIQKADIFLKLLREHNINTASTQTVQDFFKNIQETVSHLSTVSLTIAFEPSDETIKVLSQWFVFNMNKQVLFDIQVDHKLIAGAKINYNGKFKDYSLGPLFENLVKQILQPDKPVPLPQQQSAPVAVHQDSQHMEIGR